MFDLSPEIVAKFTLELEYRTTDPLNSQNRTKYPLKHFKVVFWVVLLTWWLGLHVK